MCNDDFISICVRLRFTCEEEFFVAVVVVVVVFVLFCFVLVFFFFLGGGGVVWFVCFPGLLYYNYFLTLFVIAMMHT